MPTLTPNQMQQVRDIIRKHHSAIIARVVGVEALSEQERVTLENAGLLRPGAEGSLEEAYLMGQAMGLLETPQTAQMGLAEFRAYVAKNPIPLTTREYAAIGAAQRQAAEHVRGLAERVIESTGRVVSEHEQRTDVKDAVATAIGQRISAAQLATNLGQQAQDWKRDWKRVAATELQTARLEGMADRFRENHGPDVWVFKRTSPGACRHCLRIHTGPDGHPRLFKLGQLDGTNVGRKKADWQAVRGATHPFCTCELGRVPNGWGFDVDGRLMPGAEGGVRYEDEASMERAVQREDELQKAFRVRSRVGFAGMTIAIENPAGTVRRWTDRMGNEGTTDMRWAYGYIEGTKGADGDEYDVFVGPDPASPYVWVVHQNREDSNEWDEDKAMLGFRDCHQAIEAYLEHYDDPSFLGSVSMLPVAEFVEKVFATAGSAQDGMVKSFAPSLGPDEEECFEILIDEPESIEQVPELDVDEVSAPLTLSEVAARFDKALAADHFQSSYGDRSVYSGGAGPSIAWGSPLTKPPLRAEHPALSFDKDELLAERQAINDRFRAAVTHKAEDLQPVLGFGTGQGHGPVHPFGSQAQLRLDANEDAIRDAPRRRDHIDKLHRERANATVQNAQALRKAGPLGVGEEIRANKSRLGEVVLRREAEDLYRVSYTSAGHRTQELCKSLTAASEHVWAVQQGYESAGEYRKRTGKQRVPAGAGLRFWGLHRAKERRRALPPVQ